MHLKPIILKNISNHDIDPEEIISDEELLSVFSDFSILESDKIFFSAGTSKIKEILISKEPYYSK